MTARSAMSRSVKIAPSAAWVDGDEDVFVVNTESSRVSRLGALGAVIWNRIHGAGASLEELVDVLDSLPSAPDRDDVIRFASRALDALEEQGLVVAVTTGSQEAGDLE